MHDAARSREPDRPLAAPRGPSRRLRGRGEEDLVVAVVTQHAESVLRLARRVSICDADAQDAYQRGLEIFVKNAGRLDPAKAASWLRTVVKHEALAVRAQRVAAVSRDGADLDLQEAGQLVSPEDQVVGFDRLSRSAEALRELKPDEVRALWLRAEGYSYAEIGSTFGWTHTKVNRLLAEGRARFLARYATIESGGACGEWAPVLAAIVDGAADQDSRRAAGTHLRSCAGCRATLRELRDSRAAMRALLPVGGLVVAAGGGTGSDRVLRLGETLFAAVQERATATAIKLQVAADALSVGKVAAVAASAAALASGGAAVAQDAAEPARAPGSAHGPVAERPAPAAPDAAVALAAAGPATLAEPEKPASPPAPAASTGSPAGPAHGSPASQAGHVPEFRGADGGHRAAGTKEFRGGAHSSEFASDGSREPASPGSASAAASSGSTSSGPASSAASSAQASAVEPSTSAAAAGSAPPVSAASPEPEAADPAPTNTGSPEPSSSHTSAEFTREFP